MAFATGLYALTSTPESPTLAAPAGPLAPAEKVSPSPRTSERALSSKDLWACWAGRDPAPRAVSRTPARPPRAKPVVPPKPPPPPAPSFLVRGIIHEPRDGSVVFIEHDKELCLKRRGERIRGWRVLTIDVDAITIGRDGRVERLGLAERRFASAGRGLAPGPRRPQGRGARTNRVRSHRGPGRRGLARTSRGATPLAVTPRRGDADAMVAVPASLVEEARKDPLAVYRRDGVKLAISSKDGRMDGVTISAMPRGSLAARFGFAVGDKIVAVNGQPLDSPARALQLYNSHRDSNALTVTLERSGQRRNVLFYER